MGDLTSFLAFTIMISATGAFAPGPLTIATIIVGSKGGLKEGVKMTMGHAMFEFPYVIALTMFLSSIKSTLELRAVRIALMLAILSFTIYFAYLTIKDGFRILKHGVDYDLNRHMPSSILIGLLYTGLNPHFLIWWPTVGLPIVIGIIEIGLWTLPLVYLAHVSLDFIWLPLIAFLSRRGLLALGRKYGYFVISLGILLVALMSYAAIVLLS